MIFQRLHLLIAALWVGSLWTIGYIVAPTLFATLSDRVLAGTIAGRLFRVEAWISVACAIMLLGLMWKNARPGDVLRYDRTVWVIAGMLLCTLIGYFFLQPFMSALREMAGPTGVMESSARLQFGILHGAASALYLVQSLLGVALILKAR